MGVFDLDDDKVENLRSWFGFNEPFSFGKAKPLGPMLSVLILILFSLAVLTAFKLLGTALFGTAPKGTASSLGLSGMIVAMIGAPLVVWRTSIAQDQTKTAKEALFNDKINAAVSDLHAQRQITKWDKNGKAQNGWEDDLTRRNGAIDRLAGLASEEPRSAPRIARTLSMYVKELSRKFPAKDAPETSNQKSLSEWADKLSAERSDIEHAVQVLGKLRELRGMTLDHDEIDLKRVNLQGFNLRGLNFENVSFRHAKLQGAILLCTRLRGADLGSVELQGTRLKETDLRESHLAYANLQGASLRKVRLLKSSLSCAKLNGARLIHSQLEGADFTHAKLRGVYLRKSTFDSSTVLKGVDFSGAGFREIDLSTTSVKVAHLKSVFCDASVIFTDGDRDNDIPVWPAPWDKQELSAPNFNYKWRAFQKAGGFDPDNPN